MVDNVNRPNSSTNTNAYKDAAETIKKGIQEAALSSDNPVFLTKEQLNEGIQVTKEELIAFLNSNSKTDITKEAAIYADNLDKNGDGILTSDEFKGKERRNGDIDIFSFWKTSKQGAKGKKADRNNNTEQSETPINVNQPNKTNKPKNDSSLFSRAEAAERSDNSGKSNSELNLTELNKRVKVLEEHLSKTTDENEKKLLEVEIQDLKARIKVLEGQENNSQKMIVNENDIKQIAEKIIKSGDSLDKFKNILSEDEFKKLEEIYNSLKKNDIPTPVSNTTNIAQCVDDLHKAMEGIGTNIDDIDAILSDEDISDDDFTKIVTEFEKQHGVNNAQGSESLVEWISDDTSFGDKEKLLGKLANRLASAANKGNTEAINVLCQEIFASLDGVGTINDFIEPLFKDLNNNAIISINNNYSKANNKEGINLLDDIKGDYWFGNGDEIINKIRIALRHNV